MEQFDKLADNYDYIALINSMDNPLYIKNCPKNCGKVLEIGCGSGLLLTALTPHCKKLYGIDISSKLIKKARNRLKDKAELTCTDANNLPYEDSFFDYIVTHATFHHLDRKKAAEEMKRVLKPGGKIVLVDIMKLKSKYALKHIYNRLYRYLYLKRKLKRMYGKDISNKCWEYLKGQEWRTHRKLDKKLEFTEEQLKKFYKEHFPKGKIKQIDAYNMLAVIWTKPNS